MKYCPKCGTPISDGMAFCINCGEKIESIASISAETKKEKKKSKKKFLIICIVAFLLVAIAGIYWFFLHSNSLSPLPFNLKWGDCYENVAAKDSCVKELEKSDDKDNTNGYCCHALYIMDDPQYPFLGLSEGVESLYMNYEFNSDKSLIALSAIVDYDNNCSYSYGEWIDTIMSFITENMGVDYETTEEFSHIFYHWVTDTEYVALNYDSSYDNCWISMKSLVPVEHIDVTN